MSDTNALASKESRTSLFNNSWIRIFNEDFSATANPIPIVAESKFFGMAPSNFLTAPRVSFWSTSGITIRLGEMALVDWVLIFGTDVYTKSVPDLKAAKEERIGAPW